MKKTVRPSWSSGVTLVELVISMTVLTIGILATMGSFRYISQAVSTSRIETIAANLAQEKMEVMKNKSYYQLLVTSSPATSVGYTPNFNYDSSNYPPEIITLWGAVGLTRAVEVDYASVSGTAVSTIPFTSNDTGMKKISVFVTWTERQIARKVELDSYYENPSVAALSTGFNGTVTEFGTSNPIAGAFVQVIGTPKWRSYADSGGNYSFQVAPGSYSLVCSSVGFYTATTPNTLSVIEGIYTPWNPTPVRIATGTIGSVSIYERNPSLVISQVVSSTITPNGGSGYDTQFVELFNPTTGQINIAAPGGNPHYIDLNIESTCGSPRECDDIQLTYVSTYVAPGRYYLVANTVSFQLNGSYYAADAYYTDNAGQSGTCNPNPPPGSDWNTSSNPPRRMIMQVGHNGAVWLTDSFNNYIDAVGWNHHSNAPPSWCETGCISFSSSDPAGLQQGDQIVRFSTACAVGNSYGRAYDSDNNISDFFYNDGTVPGLNYKTFNSKSGAPLGTIGGRPSTNTYVAADDLNSSAVRSSSSPVTGPQGQICTVSSFTITGVSTGTWDVSVIGINFSTVIANVIVTTGNVTLVPNSITVASWPASGYNYTVLTSTYSGGFASGLVYGSGSDYLTRLSGILVGSPSNGKTTKTDSSGFYILNVPTGTVTIEANFNSNNANYTTGDIDATIVQGGETPMPDFHLAKGGGIKGYVTYGSGALPNIAVQATNGGRIAEDTSDSTGYFYIFVATSSVAYTVTPNLDPLQSYTSLPTSPLQATVTIPGSTVFAGTITVVGALGTITGHVKYNSNSITTGVLVMASEGTISDPPASVYGSSAPAQTIVYSISSLDDGTYSLPVRASTGTYKMRAFYPVVDANSGAVSYTSKTNVVSGVTAGTTVSNQDFTWP